MNKKYGRTRLYLLILFFLILMPVLSGNLYAQNNVPPAIILSSYSISGDPLTDDTITLHLVLSNTSKNHTIYNALFTYNIDGYTFSPSAEIPNQFIIPVIQPNGKVDYDLKLSVQNALPNEQFQMNFDVDFSDEKDNMVSSRFFIKRVFRSSDVIQLLGIKVIEAEKVSENYRSVSLRIAVINQSNFTAKNVVMGLEGVNFDFSTSIPFNDISPGIHSIRYFNLNFTSTDVPEFVAKFSYDDVEGTKYASASQRIFVYLDHVVYSNETPDKAANRTFIIRTALFSALTIFLIIGTVILLFKLNKKKGV